MLMTVRQVAERLNVSRGKATNMLQTGQLEGINLNPGGRYACWRVDSTDLEAFIINQRTTCKPVKLPDLNIIVRKEPQIRMDRCVSVRQQRKAAGR